MDKEVLLPPRAVQALGITLIAGAVLVPFLLVKVTAPSVTLQRRQLRPVMVVLPIGQFKMGSTELAGNTSELPQHEVVISRQFAISETEVTQGQYQAVLNRNPAYFQEHPNWQDLPVESVSFLDAIAYCNQLSRQESLEPCYRVDGEKVNWPKGLDCRGYRLPTEAEWEYSARADLSTEFAGSARVDEVAWYGEDPKDSSTHTVSRKLPNHWNLYDMSGNVWEWVWDWYEPYNTGSQKNPIGPLIEGSYRVNRGGSWVDDARSASVSHRGRYSPGFRSRYLGFRLARSYP